MVSSILLRNPTVIDGTGAPRYRADVLVRGGKIAETGFLPPEVRADEEIDASGLCLAPGFIDIHTHADLALLNAPEHLPKVMQGVTTEVFTNCGLGFAPVTNAARSTQREFLLGLFGSDDRIGWSWNSVADLLALYESQGIGTNVVYLIPHGAVRVSVMGMEARVATALERAQMSEMVREGMRQRAWGLSTGLWYAPMCYADRAELVAVCRAAGFFATHQRDYSAHLTESTQETIDIAAEAGVPVQLSHLQLGGRPAGSANSVLEQIDQARASGVDIAYDQYPYGAGSTMVAALLPAWAGDGGPEAILRRLANQAERQKICEEITALGRDWSLVSLVGAWSKTNRAFEGVRFSEIAAARKIGIGELICRLIEEEEMKACFIAYHTTEEDVTTILCHPQQTIGSDGLHLTGKTHPRLYGTFPRVLSHFVREKRAISLETAVHKMTGAPAARLGIKERGIVAPGMAADLVLFDPSTVRDTATYEDPLRFPEGIPWVWVNGQAVKRNGEPTRALPGKVLRP